MKDEVLMILENCNNNHIDAETALVQIIDTIEKKSDFIASENSQQDWNDLRYKDVYIEGFKDCVKWLVETFD